MDEYDAKLERAGNDEEKKRVLRQLHNSMRKILEEKKDWEELSQCLNPEELDELEEEISEDVRNEMLKVFGEENVRLWELWKSKQLE
jgi:hypothetical protein